MRKNIISVVFVTMLSALAAQMDHQEEHYGSLNTEQDIPVVGDGGTQQDGSPKRRLRSDENADGGIAITGPDLPAHGKGTARSKKSKVLGMCTKKVKHKDGVCNMHGCKTCFCVCDDPEQGGSSQVDATVACNQCDQVFSSQRALVRHVDIAHALLSTANLRPAPERPPDYNAQPSPELVVAMALDARTVDRPLGWRRALLYSLASQLESDELPARFLRGNGEQLTFSSMVSELQKSRKADLVLLAGKLVSFLLHIINPEDPKGTWTAVEASSAWQFFKPDAVPLAPGTQILVNLYKQCSCPKDRLLIMGVLAQDFTRDMAMSSRLLGRPISKKRWSMCRQDFEVRMVGYDLSLFKLPRRSERMDEALIAGAVSFCLNPLHSTVVSWGQRTMVDPLTGANVHLPQVLRHARGEEMWKLYLSQRPDPLTRLGRTAFVDVLHICTSKDMIMLAGLDSIECVYGRYVLLSVSHHMA